MQAIAQAKNRALANYVKATLISDLALRDEASRGITMYVAAGASGRIEPKEVIRGTDESDAAYAKRQVLVVELWSIPDNG